MLNSRVLKFAPRRRQRGVTLIELMVSIVIGLLTIAVALGALLVSRGVSGSVSDAAQLQQRAAYALRVIGQQVRQAGSMQLNLATEVPGWNDPDDSENGPAPFQATDHVAFMSTGYSAITDVVSGTDDSLTIGYLNYWEPNAGGDKKNTLFRSCLGSGAVNNTIGGVKTPNTRITSTFSLDSGQLTCSDGASGPQPLIQNVAGFQVRYLVQQPGQAGAPAMFYAKAADIQDQGNWNQVYAVEVCLDLFGDERMDLKDLTYTDCDGTSAPFDGRLHMVFRNTFQIRSQGLF